MRNNLCGMIRRLLIREKVPLEPSEVDIGFETSDREWAICTSKPTVNLYLYGIWECHENRRRA